MRGTIKYILTTERDGEREVSRKEAIIALTGHWDDPGKAIHRVLMICGGRLRSKDGKTVLVVRPKLNN